MARCFGLERPPLVEKFYRDVVGVRAVFKPKLQQVAKGPADQRPGREP